MCLPLHQSVVSSSHSAMSPSSLSMQESKQFKHSILKNLLLRLRKGGVASRDMSFHERKGAIKHAADAALATARGAAPCWSRSLAAELISHGRQRLRLAKSKPSKCNYSSKITRKKILRRSLQRRRRQKSKAMAKAAAGVLARAMVLRRKTRALEEIVPGGRGMDECTLLGETLDYAMSLKAQVDAMQLLVRALQAPKKPFDTVSDVDLGSNSHGLE
ncbi:hypothetical protein ACP70R_027938 [Stipagrostis hirtigluma subsp. patula]